jgi:hypothetical protein
MRGGNNKPFTPAELNATAPAPMMGGRKSRRRKTAGRRKTAVRRRTGRR